MTGKRRKSLDDALAHEFVYGESALKDSSTQETVNPKDESVSEDSQTQVTENKEKTPPKPKPNKKAQSTKPSLMSQLQPETKEPIIRLTVDLPESMHQKLSMLAARTRRKKAEIVRFLLDEALKDVEE